MENTSLEKIKEKIKALGFIDENFKQPFQDNFS